MAPCGLKMVTVLRHGTLGMSGFFLKNSFLPVKDLLALDEDARLRQGRTTKATAWTVAHDLATREALVSLEREFYCPFLWHGTGIVREGVVPGGPGGRLACH